jgi:hypothetical protein
MDQLVQVVLEADNMELHFHLDLEILHQHHHRKEILVVLALSVLQKELMVAAAAVRVLLEVLLKLALIQEVVWEELVRHLLLLEYQQYMLAVVEVQHNLVALVLELQHIQQEEVVGKVEIIQEILV